MVTMNKIKVRLNICGTECTLTSEDNETYVLALGDEVEKSIQSIMARNDRVSLTLAAIITALSFCDESKKATAAADNLRSQIKARREIERMKQEIQTLRTRLSAGEAAQAAAREAAFTAPVVPEVEVPVQKAPVQEEKTAEQPEMPEPPYEEEPVEELRPAAPAVPNVHTGHYSRPLSAEVPEELDRSSFMSFFEKKETD